MNTSKWRNPYTPISKKIDRSKVGQANASLAITPKKESVPADFKTSVLKMRDNIKGISSTIRQMEETMDTIYGAMEMLDSLGKRSQKSAVLGPKSQKLLAQETEEETTSQSAASSLSNALGNIDIGQLINILQSPLVQNLLTQSNTGQKRKKEG